MPWSPVVELSSAATVPAIYLIPHPPFFSTLDGGSRDAPDTHAPTCAQCSDDNVPLRFLVRSATESSSRDTGHLESPGLPGPPFSNPPPLRLARTWVCTGKVRLREVGMERERECVCVCTEQRSVCCAETRLTTRLARQ